VLSLFGMMNWIYTSYNLRLPIPKDWRNTGDISGECGRQIWQGAKRRIRIFEQN